MYIIRIFFFYFCMAVGTHHINMKVNPSDMNAFVLYLPSMMLTTKQKIKPNLKSSHFTSTWEFHNSLYEICNMIAYSKSKLKLNMSLIFNAFKLKDNKAKSLNTEFMSKDTSEH